jgi:hypothetical protein
MTGCVSGRRDGRYLCAYYKVVLGDVLWFEIESCIHINLKAAAILDQLTNEKLGC